MERPTRPKILLVDDEPGLRQLVRVTLGRGYEFFEAGDGEEGVAVALRVRPDLVFMDVNMPKLDGFEACRRIKRDPATRQTKMIMLTVNARDIARQVGAEAGADGYIAKPYSPLMLLRQVEEIFGPSVKRK
ncbi:MAG: response regulator [Chloroflexi bacterium]|nr:response regulator [Chloroflexota bacterium]